MIIGDMRSFWKVFTALALMLPLAAFAAGTLVASAAGDDPAPRQTLIIDKQSGTPSDDPSPHGTPKAHHTDGADDHADDQADDQSEDAGDDHGRDDDGLAEA